MDYLNWGGGEGFGVGDFWVKVFIKLYLVTPLFTIA